MTKVTLLNGDCLQKLKELEDNSVDAVVTDPPYEIGFMGKGWDDSGIANNPELWKEVLRVLKPGGHLLSFSHSRTYHRQAVAVEDAGFEIRDQIMWIYGSGFPKSHNIGKAVDKIQGNEREVVGSKGSYRDIRGGALDPNLTQNRDRLEIMDTKGNSPYEGWGTALKPAHEPIVMARKPFKGNVANNVLEWGTGGINVDGCRIETTDNLNGGGYGGNNVGVATYALGDGRKTLPTNKLTKDDFTQPEGRFPANVIFDEEAGKLLDEQSGTKTGQRGIVKGTEPSHSKKNSIYGDYSMVDGKYAEPKDGLGGASRFFYCPKASKKDRDEGMTTEAKIIKGRDEGQDSRSVAYKARPIERQNIHPTVKPTDLMAYLIRLITPKGGIVLDPFMGSGSTGKAAVREGMDFIGIEREEEYMEIAKSRIEWEQKKNKHRQFFDV